MADQVDICNLALTRIGVTEFLNAITENTPNAIACDAVYEAVRDTALASFPWPFATRRSSLSSIADFERDGWTFGYALPADYLLAQYVWAGERAPNPADRVPYAIEMNDAGTGIIIISDEEDASLVYTAKVTNETLFTPTFVDCMAWLLASELALSISKNAALSQNAYKRFKLAMSEAAALSLNSSHENPPESELITIRG